MFGFFYRSFKEGFGIVWDGKPETLSYCFNQEEAKEWYTNKKGTYQKIKIKRPPNKFLEFSVPLISVDESKGENPEFGEWLITAKIELRLKQLLQRIQHLYYLDKDGFFVMRPLLETSAVKSESFGTMAIMKDILLGYFRLRPLKVVVGFDKESQKSQFQDIDIGQDFKGLSYEYLGEVYKINAYGVYVPQLREALFPGDRFQFQLDGYRFMKRQRHLDFNQTFRSYIIGPREGGKSAYAAALLAKIMFKSRVNQIELDPNFPFDCHIINRIDQAGQLGDYVDKMLRRLIPTLPSFIKKVSTSSYIKIMDGGDERYIRRRSQNSTGFRGNRGVYTIADEWGFYDSTETIDVAQGTSDQGFLGITTVNYETKKHWSEKFYDAALAKMAGRIPMEQWVHETWHKEGFQKCTSIQDYDAKIVDGTFSRIFRDFKKVFDEGAFTYTIDDRENLTDDEREDLIKTKLKQRGEDFVLAEYYGERSNSIAAFTADHLVETKIPENYDAYIVGYDESSMNTNVKKNDKPGLVICGIKDLELYVIDSVKLTPDIDIRYQEIRSRLLGLKNNYGENNVAFICDITRGSAFYNEISDRVGYIDTPVYITNAHSATDVNKNLDSSMKRIKHNVGRSHLIDLAKDEFFGKNKIHFGPLTAIEGGLVEEVANFKLSKQNRFEAQHSGNDDQVFGLLLCIYHARYEYIREGVVSAGQESIRLLTSGRMDDGSDDFDNSIYERGW